MVVLVLYVNSFCVDVWGFGFYSYHIVRILSNSDGIILGYPVLHQSWSMSAGIFNDSLGMCVDRPFDAVSFYFILFFLMNLFLFLTYV